MSQSSQSRRLSQWQRKKKKQQMRLQTGKMAHPTVASIHTQSVKATETGCFHGYDSGKKIKIIKVHILLDTIGLILAVVVHSAEVQDQAGAVTTFAALGSFQNAGWSSARLVWFNGFRRLSKAYERKATTAEAFIYVSMCRLLLTLLFDPIS